MRSAMAFALVVRFALLALGSCESSNVSRGVGARCDRSDECDDRCLPDSADYPGGFCTLVCNTTNECPSEAACVDREGGACLITCTTDASCAFLGEGWRCHDEDTREQPAQKVKVCRG